MQVGVVLRQLLKERNMSMRALARKTGIDAATISRIVGGKRRPTLEHLRTISNSFQVPLNVFFEETPSAQEEIPSGMESIPTFVEELGGIPLDFSIEMLQDKLEECNRTAETSEGRSRVLAEFKTKMDKISGQGPSIKQLKQFYDQFVTWQGTNKELILIGGVLLYFIMPLDVIPDYLFPVGYLDDAIAAQTVGRQLLKE